MGLGKKERSGDRPPGAVNIYEKERSGGWTSLYTGKEQAVGYLCIMGISPKTPSLKGFGVALPACMGTYTLRVWSHIQSLIHPHAQGTLSLTTLVWFGLVWFAILRFALQTWFAFYFPKLSLVMSLFLRSTITLQEVWNRV